MPISTPKTMLKAMVFALAGMALVFWTLGLLLADRWRVDTTRVIGAPPAAIAALVSDLGTWTKWSAMQGQLGPQTSTQVTGAPATVGQAMTWSGGRGAALLEVTAVDASSLEYEVKSLGTAETPTFSFAKGRVDWQPEGAGCRVHWREERVCDTLVERWFVWFGAIQERVRQIQVGSLAGLAQAVEGNTAGGAK